MSGDVQPRKRKDKKKKKDDLGFEEPRGTAAALGEGDVFMHSQSEHGTGGHWCAKVIFFSLLAVLITLIGLIILENRGLTELEANSVESRYSGVLEGWIEDVPDDDHHDEHTLELKHHDEEDDQSSDLEHDDHDDGDDNDVDEDHDDDEDVENDNEDDEHEDDGDDENENDDEEVKSNDDDSEEADNADDDEEADNDDDDEMQDSEEHNLDTAEDEDDIEEASIKKSYGNNANANEEDDDEDNALQKESEEYDDDDDDNKEDEADSHQNDYNDDNNHRHQDPDSDDDADDKDRDDDDVENPENDESLEENNEADEDKKSLENDDDDDDDDDSKENEDYLQNNAADNEDEEEHEEEEAEEPANIQVEAIEKEVLDDDASNEAPPAEDDKDDQSQEVSEELPPEDDTSVEDDDVEFLEPDELDELPIVEPITAPKGKPLAEVGESPSTEKPQDTLADEEEYERQQEELRKEREQASQGMWLKLTVGGALLVATHAVLRRATASRAETDPEEEPEFREETPLSDRRMTLISDPVPPPTVESKSEISQPIEKEVKKEASVNVQSSSPSKEELEEDEEEIIVSKSVQPVSTIKDIIDKELYSDEEEIEDIEEEEEEEIIVPTQISPQQAVPQAPIPDVTKEVTPEPDEDDDVEIIDEEQLEEEIEEEEISDVDDAELLNRLEAKYGRLPEPERPARTHSKMALNVFWLEDGGNSVEEEWPGEPEDAFWNEHLEQAQRELRQGEWSAALEKASAPKLQSSARARYIIAQALDVAAEAKKDNQLLSRAIAAYLELLKMNERLSDKKLLEVTTRTLDRIKFRGTYLSAEPVYKLLIRRFPNDPTHRNNLTISLLMANRADLAENVLKETLKLWPSDRLALAHLGFILKTLHNRLEEAVEAFTKALEGDTGPANEPRFYYHLGDALLLLGRFDEAHEIHKRGAKLGHFLSPNQRSLYNVDRLISKPWWNVHQTPYAKIARALEKSWKEILKEGEAARVLYEKEKEGLKERGEWSQLDLFVRGREVPNRCSRAPVTCGVVKSEVAASGCRRGQIKFSMMEAGTHVRPHVGPTNCRLRMHLGLSNTKDTFIRVDKETRQWQPGKVLMFDDSFEHEVWHNGTGARLVLIVDVWHPDLTSTERRQLPAI